MGRVNGTNVVMHGHPTDLSEFLHRLRTEYVDVDRSGRRCRERQSTVLCRRTLPESSPLLQGWRVNQCEDARQLEQALSTLGVLHVGIGSTRFSSG